MGNYLANILRPVADIRPGERKKTLIMFLYFMFTISTLYILRPLRSGLFISEFGADAIRYANVGEGLFLIFVVAVYSRLAKTLPRKLLYPGTLAFLTINALVFWVFIKQEVPYTSAGLYVWQSSFSAMITTQFWILANDIFTKSEAKRLFGLLISGGSVGGFFGGFITEQAVKFTAVENLFLVICVILGICSLLVGMLWKEVSDEHSAVGNLEAEEPEEEHHKEKVFSGKFYLILVALLVIIAKMSSTLVESQFGGTVEMYYQGASGITGFYGKFFKWLMVITFFMQIIMTKNFLAKLGASGSILILPLGIGLLSMTSFIFPLLAIAVVFRMFDASMSYSIQQASKEMLYLPIAGNIRRRAKPWIDMLGYRGAKSLAGLYMIAGSAIYGLASRQMGLLVLLLLPLWLFVSFKIRKILKKYLSELF